LLLAYCQENAQTKPRCSWQGTEVNPELSIAEQKLSHYLE